MHEVDSLMHEDDARDLKRLQIGQGGGGRGPLRKREPNSNPWKKQSINICLCVWNHKGDFVFVCQKSNPISRENTKLGVTVIRLANKYHCPFLLAKLIMKDMFFFWNAKIVFPHFKNNN